MEVGSALILPLSSRRSFNNPAHTCVFFVSLVNVVQRARGFEKLNLGGCIKITDSLLKFFAVSSLNLTHLSLFQCSQVSDVGFRSLLALYHLVHLDLHGCVRLTDDSLRLLSSENKAIDSQDCYYLPNLGVLDIGACHRLTNLEVQHLRERRMSIQINFC